MEVNEGVFEERDFFDKDAFVFHCDKLFIDLNKSTNINVFKN